VLNVTRASIPDTNHFFFTYIERPIIFKTEDGGKTYEKIVLEGIPSDKMHCMTLLEMYNKDIGVCVTYASDYLITTLDGWSSYRVIKLKSTYAQINQPSFFLDSVNIAFCLSFTWGPGYDRYNLIENQWYPYAPVPKYEPWTARNEIYDICFVDDSLGYGCGYREEGYDTPFEDVIWKTTDKGQSWEIIYKDLARSRCYEIDFLNENIGVAVGMDKEIMFTYDGGKTWEFFELPKPIRHDWGIKIAWVGHQLIITSLSGGIYRYEDVTSVDGSEFEEIKVKPYNWHSAFSVEVIDTKQREYNLKVVNSNGIVVSQQQINTKKTACSEQLDLTKLPQGAYFYMLSCGNKLITTGQFINAR
jgi:hypothetical protein